MPPCSSGSQGLDHANTGTGAGEFEQHGGAGHAVHAANAYFEAHDLSLEKVFVAVLRGDAEAVVGIGQGCGFGQNLACIVGIQAKLDIDGTFVEGTLLFDGATAAQWVVRDQVVFTAKLAQIGDFANQGHDQCGIASSIKGGRGRDTDLDRGACGRSNAHFVSFRCKWMGGLRGFHAVSWCTVANNAQCLSGGQPCFGFVIGPGQVANGTNGAATKGVVCHQALIDLCGHGVRCGFGCQPSGVTGHALNADARLPFGVGAHGFCLGWRLFQVDKNLAADGLRHGSALLHEHAATSQCWCGQQQPGDVRTQCAVGGLAHGLRSRKMRTMPKPSGRASATT
nr:MAG TPA_asm: hypothetical protein [Bacteriophage sp.]